MIDLLENEKIVFATRRHWLIIVIQEFFLLLLAVFPFLILLAAETFFSGLNYFIIQYLPFVIFYIFAWLLIIWIVGFVMWTNYYLDVILVTNRRIIDIEQLGLFSRDIAEARLENIQDIKIEVLGLVRTFLKMGDLHIQTAGASKEMFIRGVPKIHHARELIGRCQEEARRNFFGGQALSQQALNNRL